MIVGGFAAIIKGSPRTTSDIDIIVGYEPNLSEKLISSLKKVGFDVMENQLRLAIEEGTNSSIFMPESIIRIDLKVAKNSDEKEVLDQSVEEVYQGLSFKIASIEQILYGKVLYLGDISDLSDDEILDFTDARDFINVYRTASSIDLKWLERKIKDKGLIETYRRLIKKVDALG